MKGFRFELATEADDADLRAVLAATPMAGSIAVTFRREPSFFRAALADGDFRQVVACRNLDTGHIVGFGSRSIREMSVNGVVRPIGYLSSLRLVKGLRNRGLVARGYAFFRRLHADGRTPLYLTTIAEGNEVALKVLTSGRAGLPRYHFAGRYLTAALPLPRRQRARRKAAAPSGIEVVPARADDLPEILEFLRREGPRRQFFPHYRTEDFFRPDCQLLGLTPGQLLLARRGSQLVGTLAGWDQHGFKQTVINGYSGPLRWLRPVVNFVARFTGGQQLPAPGEALRYLTAALIVTAGDDAPVLRALLDQVRESPITGLSRHLLIGLHESDRLVTLLRFYRPRWYVTRLYLVCWDDGEVLRQELDERVPYLELGCL